MTKSAAADLEATKEANRLAREALNAQSDERARRQASLISAWMESRTDADQPARLARLDPSLAEAWGARDFSMSDDVEPGTLTAAAFVDVFIQGWSLPKPDAFLDFFRPHLHPNARIEQPVFPTGHGMAGFERVFHQLFVQIPDLVLSVQHSAHTDDVVLIESQCCGTLGGRPIEFSVCDRFTLAAGLIIERRSYSDPLPVLIATAKRPRAWGRAIRSLRLGTKGG